MVELSMKTLGVSDIKINLSEERQFDGLSYHVIVDLNVQNPRKD